MKNQNKLYHQLTQEPRYQISAIRKAGLPLEAFIGRRVALIT
jgi:hypothetical protein